MKRLSVIIVSYNCCDLLKNCLESIQQHNDIGEELEIIAVDNGSDGTFEKMSSVNIPDLKCIKTENRGFGAGNNAGAKLAEGEYYLFLNPDTIIREPIFSFATEKFDEDPKLGCFGVKMLDGNGNNTNSITLRFFLGFFLHQLNRIITGLGIYLPQKMYTSGAGLFIRSEAFNKIGGFDEEFFMYCEEPDICNRVNAAGYGCGYYPEKSIVHLEGRTSDARLAEKYIIQLRAWKHYCEKYGIDFYKAAKKEKRYCAFKSAVFRTLKRNEKAAEYCKIVNALDIFIDGGEL